MSSKAASPELLAEAIEAARRGERALASTNKAAADLQAALALNVADRADERAAAAQLLARLGGAAPKATYTPTPLAP